MVNKKTVAFTGGGTAGHVFPAFPVIERIRDAGFEVFWIGSRHGMEQKLVENLGLRYYPIPAGKLRRYFSLQNIADLFKIFIGFLSALRILRREKPTLLFSKGGFVSVTPVAAARFCRIPALTHESDVDPGLATRLNILMGARVLMSYEDTRAYLPAKAREKAILTGNPVRDAMLEGNADTGRRIAGVVPPHPLILVLGGSQGAGEVNNLLAGCLDDLLRVAVVVHQTGPSRREHPHRPGYLSRSFFQEELPHLLAAADLAISRSGAGSVWEFAATSTPAVLIPLRSATRGDQVRNAVMAEKRGMALSLSPHAGSEELGRTAVELLGSPERLAAMSKAATSYPAAGAADRIANQLKEAIR